MVYGSRTRVEGLILRFEDLGIGIGVYAILQGEGCGVQNSQIALTKIHREVFYLKEAL